MDNDLKFFDTEEEAISLLTQAQQVLAASKLRPHKIALNRLAEAFPPEDCSAVHREDH